MQTNTFLFFNQLGTGVLSDLWDSDERGVSLAVYTIMPLLGPTAGPLIAGYIVQYYDWPYVFYTISVLAAAFLLPGLLLLPETFGPVILRRRRSEKLKQAGVSAIRKETDGAIWARVRQSLARPFVLFGTQPIIQVLAVYFGFYFGLYQLAIAMYRTHASSTIFVYIVGYALCKSCFTARFVSLFLLS
jgi:MFS family permease